MSKKIVICGTSTTSLHLATTDLFKDWGIYSCNGAFSSLLRFNLHFELHGIDYLKNEVKPDPTYFDFLKDCGPRLVLNSKSDDYPDAQIYPLEYIQKHFSVSYFNNTISYLIAYAIAQPDVTDIALIGVDMSGDSEYAHQRPNCEFWLGLAKGKGIQIHIPDVSPLLKSSHLYGFERQPSYVVSSKQKLNELAALSKELEAKKELALKNHYYTLGMKELLELQLKLYQ